MALISNHPQVSEAVMRSSGLACTRAGLSGGCMNHNIGKNVVEAVASLKLPLFTFLHFGCLSAMKWLAG